MSRRQGLDGLARWANRDDWTDLLDEVFDRHFGDVLDEHDLDFDALDDLIGADAADMLWAWCFEDFATVPREADGVTVVDDYLKRRGWKESTTRRRHLEALKASVVGLYAVDGIATRRSVTLVDLLSARPPIVIEDPAVADVLRPGDRFAARLVEISGRMRVTGAMLVFPEPMPALIIGTLAALKERYREELLSAADAPGAIDDEAIDRSFMRELAPAFFGGAWLGSVLSEQADDETAVAINLDGEPVLFHTLSLPLTQRSAIQRLRARFDDVDGLMRDGPDRWLWTLPAGAVPQTEQMVYAAYAGDGREVAGRLELKAGTLTLTVNSAGRAVRAESLLRAAAGDLLGGTETTSQTLEQHLEANPAAVAHLLGTPAPSGAASSD